LERDAGGSFPSNYYHLEKQAKVGFKILVADIGNCVKTAGLHYSGLSLPAPALTPQLGPAHWIGCKPAV
jgi:hypothetical protein